MLIYIIPVIATVLVFSFGELSLAQPKLEGAACTPTSRSKPFPVTSHTVRLGGGEASSEMTQIQFTLIESMYANCQIVTSYALDYNIYNHWWGESKGSQSAGQSTVHINLYSGGRDVFQDAVTFPVQMGFCGPYGKPSGQSFHLEGMIGRNLIDITDEIMITTDKVFGRVGRC